MTRHLIFVLFASVCCAAQRSDNGQIQSCCLRGHFLKNSVANSVIPHLISTSATITALGDSGYGNIYSTNPSLLSGPHKTIVQLRYWAKPGKADEVAALALRAADVRVKLGSPRGILLRGNTEGVPDIVYQVELSELQTATGAQITVRGSPELESLWKQIVPLLIRYENAVYEERFPVQVERFP